ncbi:MAG: cyclic nucleotide-binding domain-containing protein [Dehalococcoidales bacterium]|jgi:CRP-like cAMP-binding protein|nr:cyclic nucleotide-binding domain-containing protein [Dehalococcoidales bacterium]
MKQIKECRIQDLQNVEIFAGLNVDEMEQVKKLCLHESYAGGEYIGTQGETTDELLIVNGGKVTIEMRIEVQPYTQKVTVATLSKGQICSWSALVEPYILTSSIKSVGPSEIIAIKAADLQRVFQKVPNIELVVMRNLTRVIARRLRDSHTQFLNLVAEMIKQGHW